MKTTFDWLKNNIIISDESQILIRDNRVLTHVGGFKSCGSIFAIYKDDSHYCAHSSCDNEWLETEPPMFGYFDINLTWDELLQQIANKYDFIRNSIIK